MVEAKVEGIVLSLLQFAIQLFDKGIYPGLVHIGLYIYIYNIVDSQNTLYLDYRGGSSKKSLTTQQLGVPTLEGWKTVW